MKVVITRSTRSMAMLSQVWSKTYYIRFLIQDQGNARRLWISVFQRIKTSSRFLRNTTCQIQGSHQVRVVVVEMGCLTGDFRCHGRGHVITKQDSPAVLSSPLNKRFLLGCLCGPCCWLFK
ncbi:hypothetical protein [Holospora undulata]|uniref:hypothetical protein n=1 Tax=Holospora undulata TaxID=1169117 RepID=UPI001267911A|nr:hypothetical protein [Holospora undulata]